MSDMSVACQDCRWSVLCLVEASIVHGYTHCARCNTAFISVWLAADPNPYEEEFAKDWSIEEKIRYASDHSRHEDGYTLNCVSEYCPRLVRSRPTTMCQFCCELSGEDLYDD